MGCSFPMALAVLVLALGLGPGASANNDLTSLRHLRNVEADDSGPEGYVLWRY